MLATLKYLKKLNEWKPRESWGQKMNYIVRGPPKWAQVGLKVAQIKGFEGDLKNGKGKGWGSQGVRVEAGTPMLPDKVTVDEVMFFFCIKLNYVV